MKKFSATVRTDSFQFPRAIGTPCAFIEAEVRFIILAESLVASLTALTILHF